MNKEFSQFKAYKALTIAALKSIAKSPTAVIFSIGFPLVFIFAFLYLNNGNNYQFKLGVAQQDTLTPHSKLLYLKTLENIELIPYTDTSIAHHKLTHGSWTGIVSFLNNDSNAIAIEYAPASMKNKALLEAYIQSNYVEGNQKPIYIKYIKSDIKEFKVIDFILPGQLGFAILAASVFGTAFLFYNLRITLVLKRFFTTPIKKIHIILAECTARVFVQLSAAIFIILVGYYFLDFTLINGWITFINMVILCLIGLFTFMSYGFIISGIAKTEAVIPPLANIVTLPQFILAGSFFPIENLPKWLQYIAEILPLTHFNNALRAVSFEGANLWDIKYEIVILLLWGVLSYFIATKTFKWT